MEDDKGIKPMHHDVFYKFRCWQGEVEEGIEANFLGVMTKEWLYEVREQYSEKRSVDTQYPGFNEEYFEWIDLLEAVTLASLKFTMIELGAGWGRWLVNAAAALRSYSRLPCRLIGVEAEPTHLKWMKMHFRDNGLDPASHQLTQAAVAHSDGRVWFLVGRSDECYGQRIVPKLWLWRYHRLQRLFFKSDRNLAGLRAEKVKAVSLDSLLRPLGRVDLIDLDVQGYELTVLSAAVEHLDRKVKRVHIETHSHEIEAGLRTLFRQIGWQNVHDYPIGENQTPWGLIKFQGGVQTWINAKLS